MKTKNKINPSEVLSHLVKANGKIEWASRYKPLDELIFTVLTQHTSDTNAEKAFEKLKKEIPIWEDVMKTPTKKIASLIHSGGLSNQKSIRIKKILETIFKEKKELKIDFLQDLSLEDARNWLMNLPGVGPKTAAVVLVLCFKKPAMPVDTHIYRVSKRLGLIGNVSNEIAHKELEKIIPKNDRYDMHIQLITHGRNICKSQKPLCNQCNLRNLGCPYFKILR